MNPTRSLRRPLAGAALALAVLVAAPSAEAVVVRTAVAYRPVYPVARTAAVVGTAAVTAAAVGTVVPALPPGCAAVVVAALPYQHCGAAWYRPVYAGTTINYTVVNPPQ